VLGFPHPDYLLDVLTAQQWAEWVEFYGLEPWGPAVDDTRHGVLCATLLAPHLPRGAKADPRDFMFRRPEEREMTPEETVAFFKSALGGGKKG
jgi:hypothetical protein